MRQGRCDLRAAAEGTVSTATSRNQVRRRSQDKAAKFAPGSREPPGPSGHGNCAIQGEAEAVAMRETEAVLLSPHALGAIVEEDGDGENEACPGSLEFATCGRSDNASAMEAGSDSGTVTAAIHTGTHNLNQALRQLQQKVSGILKAGSPAAAVGDGRSEGVLSRQGSASSSAAPFLVHRPDCEAEPEDGSLKNHVRRLVPVADDDESLPVTPSPVQTDAWPSTASEAGVGEHSQQQPSNEAVAQPMSPTRMLAPECLGAAHAEEAPPRPAQQQGHQQMQQLQQVQPDSLQQQSQASSLQPVRLALGKQQQPKFRYAKPSRPAPPQPQAPAVSAVVSAGGPKVVQAPATEQRLAGRLLEAQRLREEELRVRELEQKLRASEQHRRKLEKENQALQAKLRSVELGDDAAAEVARLRHPLDDSSTTDPLCPASESGKSKEEGEDDDDESMSSSGSSSPRPNVFGHRAPAAGTQLELKRGQPQPQTPLEQQPQQPQHPCHLQQPQQPQQQRRNSPGAAKAAFAASPPTTPSSDSLPLTGSLLRRHASANGFAANSRSSTGGGASRVSSRPGSPTSVVTRDRQRQAAQRARSPQAPPSVGQDRRAGQGAFQSKVPPALSHSASAPSWPSLRADSTASCAAAYGSPPPSIRGRQEISRPSFRNAAGSAGTGAGHAEAQSAHTTPQRGGSRASSTQSTPARSSSAARSISARRVPQGGVACCTASDAQQRSSATSPRSQRTPSPRKALSFPLQSSRSSLSPSRKPTRSPAAVAAAGSASIGSGTAATSVSRGQASMREGICSQTRASGNEDSCGVAPPPEAATMVEGCASGRSRLSGRGLVWPAPIVSAAIAATTNAGPTSSLLGSARSIPAASPTANCRSSPVVAHRWTPASSASGGADPHGSSSGTCSSPGGVGVPRRRPVDDEVASRARSRYALLWPKFSGYQKFENVGMQQSFIQQDHRKVRKRFYNELVTRWRPHNQNGCALSLDDFIAKLYYWSMEEKRNVYEVSLARYKELAAALNDSPEDQLLRRSHEEAEIEAAGYQAEVAVLSQRLAELDSVLRPQGQSASGDVSIFGYRQ